MAALKWQPFHCRLFRCKVLSFCCLVRRPRAALVWWHGPGPVKGLGSVPPALPQRIVPEFALANSRTPAALAGGHLHFHIQRAALSAASSVGFHPTHISSNLSHAAAEVSVGRPIWLISARTYPWCPPLPCQVQFPLWVVFFFLWGLVTVRDHGRH